jgi:HD superfamily phosphodiesterase
VANRARELAGKYGADEELSYAAAILHDISDAVMSRFSDDAEAESLRIGGGLMRKCGYSDDEIALTIDDAVRYHSCHDGRIPGSLEGKVLATADALFHLETDFYIYSVWVRGRENADLAEAKEFVLKKLDRDFKNKILFDDEREKARGDYETFKEIFSR